MWRVATWSLALLSTAYAATHPTTGRHVLQQGVEHVLHVSPHTSEVYYQIPMSAKSRPLFMTMTPCNAAVHWQLRIPNQFAMKASPHPHNTHFDHILHMRIPPLIEYHVSEEPRDQFVLLAGEEDDKRMLFYAHGIEANYVLLNMTATHNTEVKVIFAEERSVIDGMYPALPENHLVDYEVKTNKGKTDKVDVHFNWARPDFVDGNATGNYRFCMLISDIQIQYAMCNDFNAAVDSIHCIPGERNSLTIKGLRSGKRHHATLFLVDQRTGGRSAYVPVQIYETKENIIKSKAPIFPKDLFTTEEPSLSIRILPDAALANHQVTLPKQSKNVYVYAPVSKDVEKSARTLLVLNACNGYIRAKVFGNDTLIHQSSDFVGLKRFVLNAAAYATLRVEVVNDDLTAVNYWIWASSNVEDSPFAEVPFDKSIRVVERHCNSVNLEFLRALNDNNTRYCVHVKESRDDYVEELLNQPTQMCWAGMPVGRKAVCVQGHTAQPHAPGYVSMHVVVDALQPGVMYRLDVSAQQTNRADAQPLPYRPIFVKTNKQC